MSNLSSTELKRLHREWRRKTGRRLAIALDGVQGPFNVGAILRTAAAYRAEHVWITASGTGPDNPRVGKTALGSDRYFEVERLDDASAIADAARSRGFTVIGVELATGSAPLHEVDLTRDICLMVGHEERGLTKAALDACDGLAFLPQLGKIGSLNVATAASIAMYEWGRQQWTDPTDSASSPA